MEKYFLSDMYFVVQTCDIDNEIWTLKPESVVSSYEEALDLKRVIDKGNKTEKTRILHRKIYDCIMLSEKESAEEALKEFRNNIEKQQ